MRIFLITIALVSLGTGCASMDTSRGSRVDPKVCAGIGAGVGALGGVATGEDTKERIARAAIGGVLGGAIGGVGCWAFNKAQGPVLRPNDGVWRQQRPGAKADRCFDQLQQDRADELPDADERFRRCVNEKDNPADVAGKQDSGDVVKAPFEDLLDKAPARCRRLFEKNRSRAGEDLARHWLRDCLGVRS